MIEKLERHTRVEKGLTKDIKISCPPEQSEIVSKINELVDAVNELQEMCKSCDNQIGILAEQIAKLQHDNSEKANCQENVQADPYAEQRKWIGKACYFWGDNAQTKAFGRLEKIDQEEDEAPFMTNFGQWYDNCEPVKPDDDIIYKGGDNE